LVHFELSENMKSFLMCAAPHFKFFRGHVTSSITWPFDSP